MSTRLVVTALPEARRVRVWIPNKRLDLKPRQARAAAWLLLTLADAAERRAIPNHKDNK